MEIHVLDEPDTILLCPGHEERVLPEQHPFLHHDHGYEKGCHRYFSRGTLSCRPQDTPAGVRFP